MDRVYVVDDDVGICRALERALRAEGFEVRYSLDSAGLFRVVADWQPRLVIIDVKLGAEDGRDVVKRFRALHDTPVLMLTGEVAIDDRVYGLQSGADDYLGKPFDNRELVARARALIRRYAQTSQVTLRAGAPIVLDRQRRVVTAASGESAPLTELQSNLLSLLMERAGHVVAREEIYEAVFRRPWVPSDRSLEVHVSNLRKLLAALEPSAIEIQSVRHVGYRLFVGAAAGGANVT